MKLVRAFMVVSFIFVLSFLIVPMILFAFGIHLDAGILATLATVELAFVAVFEERIHAWLRKPQLDIEIKMEAPYCHKVEVHKLKTEQLIKYLAAQKKILGPLLTPETMKSVSDKVLLQLEELKPPFSVYYYRIGICNNGDVSAEKVEVLLTKVYEKKGHKFIRDNSFPQDNLVWSAISEDGKPVVYRHYIPPKAYRYCTLGHVWNPQYRVEDKYGIPPFPVEPDEAVFCFDVSFMSFLKYYFRRKGTYGIELQVAASNAKTMTKRFRLEMTGVWSEDEATMLKKGLTIEEMRENFEEKTKRLNREDLR